MDGAEIVARRRNGERADGGFSGAGLRPSAAGGEPKLPQGREGRPVCLQMVSGYAAGCIRGRCAHDMLPSWGKGYADRALAAGHGSMSTASNAADVIPIYL
ncbi:MAG: hypothetical protein AMXMBFR26_12870 [Porticoccaceae bacterium]